MKRTSAATYRLEGLTTVDSTPGAVRTLHESEAPAASAQTRIRCPTPCRIGGNLRPAPAPVKHSGTNLAPVTIAIRTGIRVTFNDRFPLRNPARGRDRGARRDRLRAERAR